MRVYQSNIGGELYKYSDENKTRQQVSENDQNEVYTDILKETFSYLGEQDLLSVSCLSKEWNQYGIDRLAKKQIKSLQAFISYSENLKKSKSQDYQIPKKLESYGTQDGPVVKSQNWKQITQRLSEAKKLLLDELTDLPEYAFSDLTRYCQQHHMPVGFQDFAEIAKITNVIIKTRWNAFTVNPFWKLTYRGEIKLEKIFEQASALVTTKAISTDEAKRIFEILAAEFENKQDLYQALQVYLEMPKYIGEVNKQAQLIFDLLKRGFFPSLREGKEKIDTYLNALRLFKNQSPALRFMACNAIIDLNCFLIREEYPIGSVLSEIFKELIDDDVETKFDEKKIEWNKDASCDREAHFLMLKGNFRGAFEVLIGKQKFNELNQKKFFQALRELVFKK